MDYLASFLLVIFIVLCSLTALGLFLFLLEEDQS